MVLNCIAYGCSNVHSANNRSMAFHTFPFTRPQLVKLWVYALRMDDWWYPSKTSRICGEHFLPSDYQNVPGSKRKRLKVDAVPSIFNFPEHLLKVGNSRKVLTKHVNTGDTRDVDISCDHNLPSTSCKGVKTFVNAEVQTVENSDTVTLLQRKIKTLQQKVKRKDIQISNMNDVIKEVFKSGYSNENLDRVLNKYFAASIQPSTLSSQKSVLVPIPPPVYQRPSETSVASLGQQELDNDVKLEIIVEDLVKSEASTDSFDNFICKPSHQGTIEELQDAPKIESNQLPIVQSIEKLSSGSKASTEERIEYIKHLDDSDSGDSEIVDLTQSSDSDLNSVTTPPSVQPTSSSGQHTTARPNRHVTSITSTNSMVLKYGGLFNHQFMDDVSVNKEQLILILNQLDIAFDSSIAQQCFGDSDDRVAQKFNYGSNLDLFFDNITKIVKTLSPLDQVILQKFVTDRAFEMKTKQLKLMQGQVVNFVSFSNE